MKAIAEPIDTGYAGAVRPAETGALAASISQSAVSWGAIFAGAAAAAALSLILLLLGTGLGLSSVSPWATEGIDASTFGVSSILWITFMQLAASAIGGYLAGRLRTKWASVHTDEVYFRDTAHGFLAWSIATLATAALLTSVIGAIIGGGVQAGAAVAGDTAVAAVSGVAVGTPQDDTGEATDGPTGYFVDSLFRADARSDGDGFGRNADRDEPTPAALAEMTRIFVNGIRLGSLPNEDVRYVGQVIAESTDLTQQQAEQRVRDVFADLQTALNDAEIAAREMADEAREASAYATLWLFISLLIGAFIASWAATFGGRQRDL